MNSDDKLKAISTVLGKRVEEGCDLNKTFSKCELCVPFPTAEEAKIAFNSLRVDKEPRKSLVTRSIEVKEHCLIVKWVSSEARILRVSVGSFFDHLSLVIETLKMFGPPRS